MCNKNKKTDQFETKVTFKRNVNPELFDHLQSIGDRECAERVRYLCGFGFREDLKFKWDLSQQIDKNTSNLKKDEIKQNVEIKNPIKKKLPKSAIESLTGRKK